MVYGQTVIGKGTEYLPNEKIGPPKSAEDYDIAPNHSTLIITTGYHRAPLTSDKRLFVGVSINMWPLDFVPLERVLINKLRSKLEN